ncbi:MAG: hypothetical protein WCG47_20095 [Dermatophilaceae bacterium]
MSGGPEAPREGMPWLERHLPGKHVLTVRWVPGSDTLLGVCHCGAQHSAQSPIEVWEWLLAHPVGHEGAPGIPSPNEVGALTAPAQGA